MRDRPIIFSASMVQALLAGRKTQTRRVLKPQPEVRSYGLAMPSWPPEACGYPEEIFGAKMSGRSAEKTGLRFSPGDRLWVRETCATWEGGHRDVVYRAALSDQDWSDLSHDARIGAPWNRRSPIYMPRWASRITLTVTDVRVQRVQEISEGDAWREGVDQRVYVSCRDDFRDLWDSINAKRGFGWDANPWVAAYSFTVRQGNIDG